MCHRVDRAYRAKGPSYVVAAEAEGDTTVKASDRSRSYEAPRTSPDGPLQPGFGQRRDQARRFRSGWLS